MKTPDSFRKDQSGMAIITALIAVGLVTTMLSYGFMFADIQRNSGVNQRDKYSLARMQILAKSYTESTHLLYEAILNSRVNEQLRNCMVDDTQVGGSLQVCRAGLDHPLEFGVSQASGAWVSLTNNPNVRYNQSAQLCSGVSSGLATSLVLGANPQDSSCRHKTFHMQASFRATCASGASTCTIAQSLQLRLRIVPSSDLSYSPVEITRTVNLASGSGDSWSQLTRSSRPEPPPPSAVTVTSTTSSAPPSHHASNPNSPTTSSSQQTQNGSGSSSSSSSAAPTVFTLPPPVPRPNACRSGQAASFRGRCFRFVL